MKKILLLTAAAAFALAGHAITFDEAVTKIIDNNRDVRLAYMNAEDVAGDGASAGNLADPEVEFEYLFGPTSEDNRWNVAVSQSFDWPGVYAARRRAAQADNNAFYLLAETTLADKRDEVRGALVEYIHTVQTITLLEDVAKTVDELLAAAEKSYSRGQGNILDVNKLKIEKARVAAKLVDWREQQGAAVGLLNELNGGQDCSELISGLVNYPSYEIQSLLYYTANAQNDPAVKAAIARYEAQKAMEKVADKERYPGFSVGYVHAYEDATHFNGFSVSLSLPFFSSRHKLAAAKRRTLTAEFNTSVAQTSAEAKITADYNRMKKLGTELRGLGQVFDTTDNLALLRRAYEGGQLSLVDYLTDTIYFIEAQIDYLDLNYRYNQVLASLQRYTPEPRP